MCTHGWRFGSTSRRAAVSALRTRQRGSLAAHGSQRACPSANSCAPLRAGTAPRPPCCSCCLCCSVQDERATAPTSSAAALSRVTLLPRRERVTSLVCRPFVTDELDVAIGEQMSRLQCLERSGGYDITGKRCRCLFLQGGESTGPVCAKQISDLSLVQPSLHL